jgi:hypothetical protein
VGGELEPRGESESPRRAILNHVISIRAQIGPIRRIRPIGLMDRADRPAAPAT